MDIKYNLTDARMFYALIELEGKIEFRQYFLEYLIQLAKDKKLEGQEQFHDFFRYIKINENKIQKLIDEREENKRLYYEFKQNKFANQNEETTTIQLEDAQEQVIDEREDLENKEIKNKAIIKEIDEICKEIERRLKNLTGQQLKLIFEEIIDFVKKFKTDLEKELKRQEALLFESGDKLYELLDFLEKKH